MPFVWMKRAGTTILGVGALLAALSGGDPARAQTAPTPVRYAPEAGQRQLIFVNNPEKIVLRYKESVTSSPTFGTIFDDLADPGRGQKALFRMTLEPGNYRDNFEHVYRGYLDSGDPSLGTAAPAHYAVHLYNPNSVPIIVTIVGKGFRTGTEGGRPLADMLNAEQIGNRSYVAPVTYRIAAKRSLWLMRTDIDYGRSRPLNQSTQGTFFSGAVDFDVSGGPFIVTHLAYQSFRSLTNWADMGFIARTNATATNTSAPPESRVYKGLMAHPTEETSPGGVVTNLTFTVNANTPAGELPVTYPKYVDIGGRNFAESSTETIDASFWVTHNIPSRRSDAVSNDMYDTLMPGFGTVWALSPVVAPNTPFREANIANWGIMYHDAVTVVNNDTKDRRFSLTLNNFSTSGGNIAYLSNAGVWEYRRLQGVGGANPQPFAYRTFTVPAGTVQKVDAYFILGSPSVGTVRHALEVSN